MGNLSALATNPDSSKTVYCGFSSRNLVRSTDSGETWKSITIPGQQLLRVNSIVAYERGPYEAIFSLVDRSGLHVTPSLGNVYGIRRGASTAELIPNAGAAANRLAGWCIGDQNYFALMNRQGAFFAKVGSTPKELAYSAGIPRVPINDVAFSAGKVFLATFGLGVYQADFASLGL
jgi:hypothetical protein